MTSQRMSSRFARLIGLIAMAALVFSQRGAALAQSPFSPIEGEIDGVHLTVSALADLDAPTADRVLFLEGLAIGACSAGAGSHAEGPILIFAESNQVTVRFDDGTGVSDWLLKQGDSVLIPADSDFTVINGMGDPAFQAEVLLLAVTRFEEGSTTTPVQPAIRLAKQLTDWPEGSFCDGVSDRAVLQATFKVHGWAGMDATQLYLGTGMLDADATTDGFAIAGAPASFNLLLLSGGMPTPGASTGRATWSGPRQVVSDTFDDQMPEAHVPFANPGSQPLLGIIFGTTSDSQPIFAPMQE